MAPKEVIVPWAVSPKILFSHFNTNPQGLSHKEALHRQEHYGYNDVSKKEERHGLTIFLSQFKNPLILILLAATLISRFLGENVNALVILLMVLLNVFLGFFQEYRAERTIRELKKYVSYQAKVLRDGELVELDAKELVPGDIVHLSIGDLVPADLRLLAEEDLTADESSLTGESLPVSKQTSSVSKYRSLPQELRNMAFMGTSIAAGFGKGMVVATGGRTFFGKTAAYLQKKEPEADFQKSIHRFSNFLLMVVVVMTVFIFIANALLGKGYLISFMFALALAVGITPEILPVIMTVTLSKGASQMAREKVITKRLSSVEDLGNIDTLCCDKTGTLTEGKLELQDYRDVEGKRDTKVVLYSMLCSSVPHLKTAALGNPLDKAIWESSAGKGLATDAREYTFLDQNEFDYHRRRMSVLVEHASSTLLIAKGAPESIFSICQNVSLKGKSIPFTAKLHHALRVRVHQYEKDGYKVIAIAERKVQQKKMNRSDEQKLTLIGFLLFLDPPKKSAKEALALLKQLGVHIKVISGDSPVITEKICREVGLVLKDRIITGEELERLTPTEMEEYSQRYTVFARVSPEQKYKIVASLNKEGHIVGFLGDGVNDAPALRAADVGISVDTGAGIAKEAADIILLKKSLHVLIDGIMQGRKIFSNITKYILNTISANYGNMFTVAISSLFLRFIPLLPSQILLNNFISDIPNLTISTDNVDAELLHKPKRWNFKLISRFMIYFGLLSSVFDLILILAMLLIFQSTPAEFRTGWFVMSAISEIIILFSLRTHVSFFKSRPSMWLIAVSFITIFTTLALPYFLFGQRFFELVPLSGELMLLIGIVLLGYFIAAEIAKRYFFRKFAE